MLNWKSLFQNKAFESKKNFESLLDDFDKLVLHLGGDLESDVVRGFKSLLAVQSERLIQHLKILSAILNISSLFSSHSHLDEVLSHITESVREVLNYSRVIILLLNEDRSILECKIITGMTSKQKVKALTRPFIMDKHDCIETKVARHGKSYFIKDINDPRLTATDLKIMDFFERGCTIYVPIHSKKGIIGVLGVDRKSQMHLMQPADVYRVQLFANYIGVLIENAKLYESIIEHKNRFQNILRQSPDGIIVTSPTGEIKLFNKAAERMLRIPKSGSLGQPIEQLLGKEIIRRVRGALSKQDRSRFYDLNFQRADGQNLILNLSALNIKSENTSEIVLIFHDITAKKMIDKHIQRLDKLASVGTMAAGIAHEIRSPLTSISMDLDSLYESASEKDKVEQTVIQVLNEIERIDRIVNNLLQFSRPARTEFCSFELPDIMNESILLVRKRIGEKRIHFKTNFPSNAMELIGNPDRLKQMIVNLLINAVEAIDLEGVITINAELLGENNKHMCKELKDSFFDEHKNILRIGIQDSGAGVLSKFIDKIFDPYFTTKIYGTGLGLSIASMIAKEHQGYLSVSSEPGQGALFEVFLPTKPFINKDTEAT